MLPLIHQHSVDKCLSPRAIQWTIKKCKTLGQFYESLYILAIVFPSRKGTMDLYINPPYLFPFLLASSMHHLPSNLVSSLGLPGWLKPNQLLITRSPSKKTSPDLSLNLGLTSLSSLCHCPRVHWTSMCPHTTLECVLLERSLIM